MSKRYEKIGNFVVEFDRMYYIAYAGGKRELSKEHQRNWDKTNQLPGLLQIKERRKLGLENNPNVVPIKGVDLISFFKELGYIPFFDQYFVHTGILQLTDIVIFESIRQKSYEIALRS